MKDEEFLQHAAPLEGAAGCERKRNDPRLVRDDWGLALTIVVYVITIPVCWLGLDGLMALLVIALQAGGKR